VAESVRQQILISGVGGQGVLFVTRLMAEAAIARGLPVFTSETHGMAQRGGTVVSHFKAGEFYSPLVRPGQADGLLVLKADNLAQHGAFLKPGGWAVVNAAGRAGLEVDGALFTIDADALARSSGEAKSVNLITLGYALAAAGEAGAAAGLLFCRLPEIRRVVEKNFGKKTPPAESFLKSLQRGYEALRS
jgi:indolepyruvate ferredoxin oxidoreductase beta subunit